MEFELQAWLNDKCGSWYMTLLNWIASGLNSIAKTTFVQFRVPFCMFWLFLFFFKKYGLSYYLFVCFEIKDRFPCCFLCWSSLMFGTWMCFTGWTILGGHLRTQIIRFASLSHSSLLLALFSFSILEMHHLFHYVPNQLCLLLFV